MLIFRTCLLLLGGCLLLAGCSRAPAVPVAKLSGQVTLDGTPVEHGTINFVPVEGNKPTAGAEVKEGKYSASVPLGKMKVKISAPRVTGLAPAFEGQPNSPMNDVTEESIPAIYNTETEIVEDVKASRSDLNFELKGNPAKS